MFTIKSIERKAINYDYIIFVRENWSKLKQLPKLSIDEISQYENDLYRMYLYAFYEYIDKLSEFSVSELKRPINYANDNAYLMASYGGQIETMKYLEEKGIDIYSKNIIGDNAYILASRGGQIEVMKYLEEKGFDIHIKNIYGQNASASNMKQWK